MIRQERPRPRTVRRRWFVIAGILLVLFLSASSLSRFYTDLLWYREVGFIDVFWTILWTRAGTGAVLGLLAGLIVLVNLEVARRAAPRYRFVTPGGDIAEQYRSVFRPYARIANLGLAAVIALLTGLSASTAWERFLLWRNAQPFGVRAPAPFGRDVSFYVFSIPFQRTILGWLFGVVVVSLLLGALAHVANGSIAFEPNRIRVASIVKVHVSVLLGIVALLKAWAYRLDQFELVYSPRGVVTGASYTDVHAQLPALRLLMVIAVVAAVIFFVNLRFRGWLLPGAALALWLFSSILLGAVIPGVVQRFQVTPNESQKERPFITRNIEATRRAFELDRIKVDRFPATEDLDAATIAENAGTIRNVRIWDPRVLQPTFARLQAIRTFYEFDDVDVDRYTLDGELRQVMLSAREIDPSRLPTGAQNWINTHLTYTHGFGLVATPSNAVTSQGLPQLLVHDLPPRGSDTFLAEQPRIYYGQRTTGYALVGSNQEEIDYPLGENERETSRYSGKGGIALSNVLRRLAFAIRFGDTDLLISDLVTPRSRVLMRRNILERAQTAAPFLRFDHDPYLVVGDERLYWVLDAYTATDRFPYSERIDMTNVVGARGTLRGVANYVRNPVKVVVDAFDGTMTYYVVNSEPLIDTYQAAFPDLFRPGREMPVELQRHMRYPEDLFKVQAWQYRLYHILDPQRLYEREDEWDIPNDPVLSRGDQTFLMDPYYLVMRLPGEDEVEFVLMLPFQPRGRPILNGWVAARMDPGHYGELVALSFPRGVTIEGPENISARIEQDPAIARQFTLWEGAGSRVDRGNLFVIPLGRSLIYVQPIYLVAAKAEQALPELQRVVVVVGDRIGFEETFEESLQAAVRGEGPSVVAPDEDGEGPSRPAAPSGDIAELLDQAAEHFQNADEALRNGDLAGYQREVEAGQRAVDQARQQQEEAG